MTIDWWDNGDDDDPGSLSESESRQLSYEQRKRALSRAWIAPPSTPWSANEPRYWNYVAPSGPVTNVMTPAAINPAKGAGPVGPPTAGSLPSNGTGGVALTREEIAEFRARERQRFCWLRDGAGIWSICN
jgi:hypothetical protein